MFWGKNVNVQKITNKRVQVIIKRTEYNIRCILETSSSWKIFTQGNIAEGIYMSKRIKTIQTFLLLTAPAASSACLAKAVPSAVTCCIQNITSLIWMQRRWGIRKNFWRHFHGQRFYNFTNLLKNIRYRVQASRYFREEPIHPWQIYCLVNWIKSTSSFASHIKINRKSWQLIFWVPWHP